MRLGVMWVRVVLLDVVMLCVVVGSDVANSGGCVNETDVGSLLDHFWITFVSLLDKCCNSITFVSLLYHCCITFASHVDHFWITCVTASLLYHF